MFIWLVELCSNLSVQCSTQYYLTQLLKTRIITSYVFYQKVYHATYRTSDALFSFARKADNLTAISEPII
jgi:hypothetical protein